MSHSADELKTVTIIGSRSASAVAFSLPPSFSHHLPSPSCTVHSNWSHTRHASRTQGRDIVVNRVLSGLFAPRTVRPWKFHPIYGHFAQWEIHPTDVSPCTRHFAPWTWGETSIDVHGGETSMGETYGRNIHGANRPWGEMSIDGVKRPWANCPRGEKSINQPNDPRANGRIHRHAFHAATNQERCEGVTD